MEEARFSLKITKFLTELTKSQQQCFAELMLQAANSQTDRNIFTRMRVPTSVEDFNEFYLMAPNSINMNLPYPVVKN